VRFTMDRTAASGCDGVVSWRELVGSREPAPCSSPERFELRRIHPCGGEGTASMPRMNRTKPP
jgi:hypothetical protein